MSVGVFDNEIQSQISLTDRFEQMVLLLIMGLVAELLALFVLWSEGLLIAFTGAIVAGMVAMVGTGIACSFSARRTDAAAKRFETWR